MIQIKLFDGHGERLEKIINDWLAVEADSIDVIDIKYSAAEDMNSVLIMYRER